MKTIIAGSRNITGYHQVTKAVEDSGFQITEVVSGGANGVDKLGERLAKASLLPCKVFAADWNKYGKRAGYVRNSEMAEYAEALIAVWDGKSRGTDHMIRTARVQGLKVFVMIVRD